MFPEKQKVTICETEKYKIREKKQLQTDGGIITTISYRDVDTSDKRPIFNQYSLTDMIKAGIDVKQVNTKVLNQNLKNVE